MVDTSILGDRLVGRDRELAAVGEFLGDADTHGATLVFTGEPGVGKTALLDAAAELAATRAIRVIHGGGVEFESDVSYAGLHQLIDPLSDELAALSRSSRSALEVALGLGDGPPPDRLVVLSSALALFRRAASRGPLVIAVDDLHWLDRASAAVVGFVARRVRGSRIGVIGATRPDVGGFFERSGLRELDVAPLSPAESMGVLERHFAHLPARVRRDVAREAQGNPLALLEFGASAAPSPGVRPGRAAGADGGTRRVRSLYEARVGALPEATQRLLLLAVLDGSGDVGVLAAAAADGSNGLNALGPAELDRLIVLDDRTSELRFRHPMIKSAVVERSTHEQRRAAHSRLAQLFSDQPERRGDHLAQAAVAPDEDIAAAVEDGAHRTLQRGDVVGAVARLLRAADLSPERRNRSRRLADAAYVGAQYAGRLDSSSELLRDAHHTDPTVGETLRAAVATAYLLLNGDGDAETAHHLLVVAIEAALREPDHDHDGLSEALYTLVLLCHYAGRSEYWVPFHAAMSQVSTAATAEVRLLAETYADPLTASSWAGSHLDREIDSLRDVEDVAVIIRVAIAGFYVDRLAGCRSALWRVIHDGRDGGAVGSAMSALLMVAFDEFNAGRWDEAQQLAEEGTALCEEFGFRLFAWSGRYAVALITANRGDRDSCRQICAAMFEWAEPRQLGRLAAYAHHALAQAALGAGDFEQCYAHALAISPAGTLRSHSPQALWVAVDLVDAALHTGRRSEARAHANAMLGADLARLSPRYALATAVAAAMVAPDDEASELFDVALALPGVDEWPFEVARAHFAHGERLRRLRRNVDARLELGAAIGGFDRLGARQWSQRAATELAATGALRQRAGGGGGGAGMLTPQQREIALLAATGLTNRQIADRLYISSRTVSAHLYRVFPKLGITSRAALRDAMNRSSANVEG